MKHAIILLLLAFICLSIGCSHKEIREGTVYEMVFEPERRWTAKEEMKISTGKNIMPLQVTMLYIDDEDYIVRIESYESTQKTGHGPAFGTRKTRTFYVTQQVFESLKKGDLYKFDRETAETSDLDIKMRASEASIK